MKIIVLDGYTVNPGDNPWTPIEAIGDLTVYDRTSSEQIFERARAADILVTNKTPLSGELLRRLEQLKYIAVLATGYDVVDVSTAKQLGIPVSNVPVYSTRAVAQHVFAMLLCFVNRVQRHHDSVVDGQWCSSPDFSYWLSPISEFAGKTMGIVGWGRIGRATATLANAFGMRILAASRSRNEPPQWNDFEWREIPELFSESDVVSLHCPQTPETIHLVDAELISIMKPEAILVNTARGRLVVEEDLAKALHAGTLGGACLDVVAEEPIRADNPLRTAPNCLITPHIAWTAIEARKRLMQTTADNISAFLSGRPIHVVN